MRPLQRNPPLRRLRSCKPGKPASCEHDYESSDLLEGTFGEIRRPTTAVLEDIEVIDDEVCAVEMPRQDGVLEPEPVIRREGHSGAPRDRSRVGLSRHLPPVAWCGRTCPKRMHAQRTAVIGQHDLDDILSRSVHIHPRSDERR